MPQWRKLWTKTTESLDINDMPDDFHRYLWLMLPLITCREGRGIDNPDWIKAKALPLRSDVSSNHVAKAMDWYCKHGMLVRYEADGRRYFAIQNWGKYQGDTTREAPSNYPEPPTEQLTTNSRPTPELVLSNANHAASVSVSESESSVVERESEKQNGQAYAAILARWSELFPNRPHPTERNKALRAKALTRMADDDFRDGWDAALVRMTRAGEFVQDKTWFTLNWFLENDSNWRKCADGNYDDKKPGNGPIKVRV